MVLFWFGGHSFNKMMEYLFTWIGGQGAQQHIVLTEHRMISTSPQLPSEVVICELEFVLLKLRASALSL